MAEIVDFGLQQHKIKMDSRYFENVLSVVAGDTGRRIEVQLLDTNGMVQNTTGLNLRLNAVVAGKATFTDATLVEGTTGKYRLDLSNGMFLAPGKWQFQWLITDSAGKKLHSFAFTGNIGKNISEGGSQATNFYVNLEDLKAMQDDLVNGTFDSEVLETNITEKLTDLETQYAPKLTEVTSQLAHKAEKVYVDNELQKLHSNIQGFFDTVTTLETAFPTGNENNYVVKADDYIYHWNATAWVSTGYLFNTTLLADKSVKPEMLYDYQIGKNKIDSSKMDVGLIGANGIPYKTGDYITTDFIPVTPSDPFTLSGSGGGNVYAYYDSSKALLGERVILNGSLPNGITLTPDNVSAAFVRVSFDGKYTNFMLEYGSEKTQFIPFGYILNRLQNNEIIEAKGDFKSLKEKLDAIENTNPNTFDFSQMTLPYILNQRLVCNDSDKTVTAKYAGVDFGNTSDVTMMRAKVIFPEGAVGATIAIINTANGKSKVMDIVTGSLHLVFTDTKVSVGLYDNQVNDVVYSYTYTSPIKRDGITEYDLGFLMDKATNTITLFTPDGYKTYSDSGAMVSLMGQYGIWEHYYNNNEGIARPEFTRFYTKDANNEVLLEDDFVRPNGVIGISPSGHVYSTFHEV